MPSQSPGEIFNRKVFMTSFGTRTCGIFFIGALGLSGCGSGSGGTVEDDDATRGQTQFDVLLDEGLAIADVLDPLSPATNMPAGGTATFQGIAALNWAPPVSDASETNLLSRVTLNADFDAGTIGGVFADFERASGAQIGGLLAVTSGTITGNAVSFNLVGQLSGAVEGDVVASTQNATFLGDGAQGIEGDLTGTFTGIGIPEEPLIDSRFVATKTTP